MVAHNQAHLYILIHAGKTLVCNKSFLKLMGLEQWLSSSEHCSCRGPGFECKNPHGSSQLSGHAHRKMRFVLFGVFFVVLLLFWGFYVLF